MKRTLYDSITVIQGASGKVVDRNGCLSAVFVADVSAVSGSPTTSAIGIVVTHCDTESGMIACSSAAKRNRQSRLVCRGVGRST